MVATVVLILEAAKLVGTTPKSLSQIINDKYQKNFFDLINDYRVKDACNLLAEHSNQELRINEIMYRPSFVGGLKSSKDMTSG